MEGDPHVTTFDKVRYDLQAAGEFVGIESLDDELVVQYRLEAAGQPPRVSYITAVAARVADSRVVVTARADTLLRVDGEAVDLSDGEIMYLNEDASAVLVRQGDRYSVIWPDGSNLHLDHYNKYLNGFFLASEGRDGRLGGLFGNADNDGSNDFRTREGRLLDSPPEFNVLYQTFAESWRVNPEESLFDYTEGENTATFTDRSVPVGPATIDDLPPADRARAEVACRAAGVVEPEPFEQCVIDVGFSGDESFIASALNAQTPEIFTPAPKAMPVPIVSGACRPSAAAIATATWRSDTARTGRSGGVAPGTEAAWTAHSFRPGHVPLVVDGRVIAARERALVALDAVSGGELWSTDGPGSRIAGEGLVAAGGAVFAAWEDALTAYDLAGGTECWRLPIGRPTAAAYADGRLYVSVDEGETGWVAAVDAATGQILWRTDARNLAPSLWPSPTAPAVGGDLVYVGDGPEVVALDRASGAVRWRARTGGNIAAGVSFADDGVVYVPGQDRGLHALDAGSGAARWTFVEPGVVMGSPVAVAGDRVFVADDRHLHALNSSTGEEVWRIDAERTLRFGAPLVVGNRLVAINHQGELVVFDIATGAEVRRVQVVDPVVYGEVAPTVGAGGLFFVLSNAVLYAYR